MNELKVNKIKKEDFLKIKEENVILITNPGRMGDEDGSTFVVKEGENYYLYRVDGWMYPDRKIKEKDRITLNDALKQFPKWNEAWHNGSNENYQGKYKYLYMGFGNGLCVDNSIYSIFKPYLEEVVNDYLKTYNEDEKKDMQYAAIYSMWKEALKKMISDNK